MVKDLRITIDYRENPSGIPSMLEEMGLNVTIERLTVGDYIIENLITIERKTASDFVLSIIQQRLFAQCKKLKNHSPRSLLFIEGNPYKTHHNIQVSAVKGAILAITTGWQLPVFFTIDKQDTVNQLINTGKQLLAEPPHLYKEVPYAYKPKRLNNQQVHFLSSAPGIGKARAKDILTHFGTLRNVSNASIAELKEVEGVGDKIAGELHEFFNREFKKG